MSASGCREGLRAFTIFRPVVEGPVLIHRERDCAGSNVSTAPARVGQGHYRVFSPDQFVDNGDVSITKHATSLQNPGVNRFVTVVLSLVGPVPQRSQIDVFIRDEADALTDDALFVECTIERMPI